MIEPRVITASRWRVAGYLGIALGFVAIALFVPGDGGPAWRWWCGGFFALGAIVFAVSLARPQYVALDPDGFTIGGGLARTPRRVRWRDVEAVFVFRQGRGGVMAGYTLVPAARADSYWGDLSRRFGADGLLPKTVPGGAKGIVAALNAYRANLPR